MEQRQRKHTTASVTPRLELQCNSLMIQQYNNKPPNFIILEHTLSSSKFSHLINHLLSHERHSLDSQVSPYFCSL